MTHSFFSCMLFSSMHYYFLIILSTLCASCVHGAFIEAHHSQTNLNKMTHLHFYKHNVLSGQNLTTVRIAGARNVSFTFTIVLDSPLTETPDPASKLVGRAHGIPTMASQDNNSVLEAISFVFLEGKYNGSTRNLLGRNPFLKKVREIPLVGGTRVFRFAHGYALLKSINVHPRSGKSVLEFIVVVMHG